MAITTDWQDMPRGLVRVRRSDRVAWIVLDAPPANNYSPDMLRDIDEAVLDARSESEVDVVVITGGGDKFFCSGADIQVLSNAAPEWKYSFCLHETFHVIFILNDRRNSSIVEALTGNNEREKKNAF